MSQEIKPGINLSVVQTSKFKTTQISIRFATPLTARNLNQRSLLAAVMENSSHNLPDPKLMNKVLADMYGATFGVDVTRRGNVHELSFNLSVVNDKYLQEEVDLLTEAFNFLQKIIFNPCLVGHAFQENILYREKQHLQNNIASLVEDKQDYAVVQTQKQYFSEDAQKMPYYGVNELINEIQADELFHVYKDMILTNNVSIIVVGDVTENEILPYVKQFPFESRNKTKLNYFYHQPEHNVSETIEEDDVIQAKLCLAYQTAIYFGDVPYYALLVFNGLFGGMPHSKLFMNIRERESLAYYASSYLDSYRGMLLVQSGIDQSNMKKVIELVDIQLQSIIAGDFTDTELQQTKVMLQGQYRNRLDHINALREQAIIKEIFPNLDFSTDKYLENIENVTKEDVIAVANKIKLQNIYCLQGADC